MSISVISFKVGKHTSPYSKSFSVEQAQIAKQFHENFPNYKITPLAKLEILAQKLGIGGLYVKDESYRFGLNAFKGLGGSYALAKVIAQKLGISVQEAFNAESEKFTFVTATDGNHGRGIAWAAKYLGQKAVVYMPKGSSVERLNNIRALGAIAEITEFNYDDTVRFAHQQSEANGWTLVQDTAWDGYEEIPTWIMQGYMTMALEAVQSLGDTIPTHIFLQAGVGAMAGALTGFFADYYKEQMPQLVIVEPHQANCLFKTAKANDGKLHKVDGDLDSIMAGLCCGEVCTVGWDIIRKHAGYFASCPDYVAADGMRVLGNPLLGDNRIISGESGAVTVGLIYHLLMDPVLQGVKNELHLNDKSIVLCFSTEGDTDKENYRKIVWEGKYHK